MRARLAQNVHACFLWSLLHLHHSEGVKQSETDARLRVCVSHSAAVGLSYITMLVFVGSGG